MTSNEPTRGSDLAVNTLSLCAQIRDSHGPAWPTSAPDNGSGGSFSTVSIKNYLAVSKRKVAEDAEAGHPLVIDLELKS